MSELPSVKMNMLELVFTHCPNNFLAQAFSKTSLKIYPATNDGCVIMDTCNFTFLHNSTRKVSNDKF